jgi:hypothetical protein
MGNRANAKWLHWPFDENSGTRTQPRGKGFSQDMDAAKVHGANWTQHDGDPALQFDGIDDWVETTFAGIGEDADRTVAAWIKLGPDFGKASGQAIIGWGDFFIADTKRRSGRAWELGIGDTNQKADLFGRLKVAVGGPMIVGHEDLRDGQWHHVAAVYLSDAAPDGRGIVLLYVDARLQQRWFGSSAFRVNTKTETGRSEPVQFGRQVMRGGFRREFFKGSIDDVFIIDQALSGDDIRELMQKKTVL